MAKIPEEILDKLFNLNEHVTQAKMAPLTDEELLSTMQKMKQRGGFQNGGFLPAGGIAQTPTAMGGNPLQGDGPRPFLPIAGFQGNSTFNNQAGTSPPLLPELQGGQRTADPSLFQRLDASGNPMQGQVPQQQYQGQGQPQGTGMLAQAQRAQPGAAGFETTINIGADGQLRQLMLRRAKQGRMA